MTKKLSEKSFQKAKEFILEQSRPLERALFFYHFESGSKEAVIKELSAFQNSDGGSGNSLEPDIRAKTSSVVATKYMLQVLVDCKETRSSPLVKSSILYLQKYYDYQKKLWPLVDEKINEAPHAPWWELSELENEFNGFRINPRAGMVRCYDFYEAPIPDGLMEKLFSDIESLSQKIKFFDLISLLQFYECSRINEKRKFYLFKKIVEGAKKIISINPETWKRFSLKPLWLAPCPDAPLAEIFSESLQTNLDYEIENQDICGAWFPTWEWGAYDPESWQIAKIEWSGILTLAMLRSLRDFDRISGRSPEVRTSHVKYHID